MNHKFDIVIVNCFETYENRVCLLKKVFEDEGKTVRVITSDYCHMHKKARTDFPDDFEAIHVRPYRKNLSVDRLLSHYRFAETAMKRVAEIHPQLVWILVPPNSLVKFAAKFKEQYPDSKLVFDMIDMWPETMPISQFKTLFPFTIWKNLRDRHLQSADVVVTECDLYQSVLDKCYRGRIYTLYLAWEGTPVAANPNPPRDRIALCYLGSINNIVDISAICSVISSINQPVEFHIIGDGEKRDELICQAEAAGAQVIYHGKIYDKQQKQVIFDHCHMGINFMKDSVFVGLSMKSIDYFEAGLPVLNNIKGDTWRLVEEEQVGLNYDRSSITCEQILEIQAYRSNVRESFNMHFTESVFRDKVKEILLQVEG